MKKNYLFSNNNEIDLIVLFKLIWGGKIKILLVTTITFLIGLAYSYQLPKNNLYSLTIYPSDNSEFYRNIFIEKIIYGGPENQKNYNLIIFERFFSEFQDYDEFLSFIKNTKKVRENISKFNTKDQEKKLFNYTKFLEIIQKNSDSQVDLNLKWDNRTEALDILKNTLNLVINNLEKKIYKEFNSFLYMQEKIDLAKKQERLEFLKKQSAFAKELNISKFQLNNFDLSRSESLLNLGDENMDYYLRGYELIDKEIEYIENYNNNKFEIVKEEINALMKDDIKWVNYNLNSIKVKPLTNTKLILIISIILGLVFGILYTMFVYEFQSKSIEKKK